MGWKREAGVSHGKNDGDKIIETVTGAEQTGLRCPAACFSVFVYGLGWTVALGNHFQGTEVYDDGGDVAFAFTGRRNYLPIDGALITGDRPRDEGGYDPQRYISS